MPKKTTILIVILAIITGLLIYLAVRSDQASNILTQMTPESEISPTPSVIAPYASISFSPPTLDLTTSQSSSNSVELQIDTQGKNVATVQIELQYDPRIVSNIRFVEPTATPPFFGTNQLELINSVDQEQGRATYATAIPVQESERNGMGPIVAMNFTITKIPGVPSTTITILPKSAVTTLSTRESVLGNTLPLTIILSN